MKKREYPAIVRSIARAVLAGWLLLGALVLNVTVLSGIFFFVLNPMPWNYPGDPPLFDLLLYAGGVVLLINVPGWLLARWLHGASSVMAWLARVGASVSVGLIVAGAVGIVERHDVRWAPVRNGIRQYGDAIAAAAGDKDRTLSREEFQSFKGRFIPTPVSVQLPGHGTVTLRMGHAIYPYVGVDFGEHYVLFDPPTMLCWYTD